MEERRLVLLLARGESYLVEVSGSMFHTKSGTINIASLKKKKIGDKIKTHLGKEFTIVEPNIIDILKKRVRRTAQVILPKDAALLLSYTGIRPDSLVVDAGTGSGYLAIFLANYISKGTIVTYEKNKRFVKIAKENIKNSGLTNIRLKQKDVTKGIDEKNVDLVVLDLQDIKKVIKHAYNSLKVGGWLVVYSPTIEKLIEVIKEVRRVGFFEANTVENIVREWQAERTIRPKTMGLMHTGFLTFARKVK
jgi:tRNA (adenine57-N1/adenine58-N1)-methyltransferase